MDFEKKRPIKFGDLRRKVFPPDNYIVDEGLLAKEGILWISGPPKVRKSFTAQTVMLDLVTGRNLFGAGRTISGGAIKPAFRVSTPQRVLFLEQEIGEYDVKNRFEPAQMAFNDQEQALIDENLIVLSQDHTMRLDTTEGCLRIGEVIQESKPTVVVFDPLAKFHNAKENDAQEMGIVMANITRLRNTFKFATIILHHEGKAKDRSGPDRMRGSSVMFADGDSFLTLKEINKNAGIVRIDFTIRRGEPITSILLKLGDEGLMHFQKWLGGRGRDD